MITIINPISILKILFYRQKNIFNITRKPPQQRGREEVRVQSTNSGLDWILDDNCNCIIVKQYSMHYDAPFLQIAMNSIEKRPTIIISNCKLHELMICQCLDGICRLDRDRL